MSNWKDRIGRDPRVIELGKLKKRRHRELYDDPQFLIGSAQLIKQLAAEQEQNGAVVQRFFREFSHPIAPKLGKLNGFLRGLQDLRLKRLLRRYVEFANRFRVAFVLNNKSGHFQIIEELPGSAKFHLRIAKGQLLPLQKKTDDDPYEALFESDTVKVPQALQGLIDSQQAKFVRIDDRDGSSILSRLESFAYSPEAITFVNHCAEQPYLLCFIGEKVTNEQFRKAEKAVSAFLRESYKRGRAGRPTDTAKLRKLQRLLEKPGSLKSKAVELAGKASNFESHQSWISRYRKKLKQIPS